MSALPLIYRKIVLSQVGGPKQAPPWRLDPPTDTRMPIFMDVTLYSNPEGNLYGDGSEYAIPGATTFRYIDKEGCYVSFKRLSMIIPLSESKIGQ